ncbi:MAG: NmrA family NAD(P)-binding protein [Solirubrobacterales bacterium]|nr:NmrA family NAD(P)-binding protein [Solirubrobacterales bacterium]
MLAQAGWEVRCMVRDRAGSRARELERRGFALHEGDVLRPESLRGAGRGVDSAYYLIHSMGRGGAGDFVANERGGCEVVRGHGPNGGDQPGRLPRRAR